MEERRIERTAAGMAWAVIIGFLLFFGWAVLKQFT
jgi:hypothetical protein